VFQIKAFLALIGICCAALFGPSGLSVPAAQAQTAVLRIATDQEKEGGYLVDITQAAFQRAGYQVEFSFVPWARALDGTIKGHYDVLMAAYFTSERAKLMAYTEQIGSVEVYFWKRADSVIPYNSLDDVKNLTIGLVRNSVVNDEFNKILPTLKIDYGNNGEINLLKLIAGKIDLFVEKRELVDVLLNKTHIAQRDKVQPLGAPLMSGKFYNCVSRVRPDWEKIMADFNDGLRAIRADGTEKAILMKHGLATS
jgi:polar amino acid transport system substrate-binding protein